MNAHVCCTDKQLANWDLSIKCDLEKLVAGIVHLACCLLQDKMDQKASLKALPTDIKIGALLNVYQ